MSSTNAPGFSSVVYFDAAGNVGYDARNDYMFDGEGRLCASYTPAGGWIG